MTLADSVELPYPSAAELGDQLVARIQGRKDQLDIIGVFLKLQPLPPDTIGSARSEVRSFRAYRWAKTTRSYIDIFGWDGGVVCYQLIIDKTHYYVVTFSTNCLPDYDSVFEKIMASFKYQPGEYRP
ncbi:hypothetical protein AGMMS49957_10680 [Synergistales bacterium]|nr:hypothetical protein AGMMS49957_10680 [Synergistales bacterium]